jgi:hypothetical protein
MSPAKDNEANHHRYIVNSSLFQKRTAFNCPDGKYSVNYEVHPWVEKNCIPHNKSWIPNPSLVSVLDGLSGTLLDIGDVPDSDLEQGDIVKMKFKVTFSVNRQNWLTNLIPLQIVRVGRVDPTAPQNPVFTGDHEGVVLLRPGSKLTLVPGKNTRWICLSYDMLTSLLFFPSLRFNTRSTPHPTSSFRLTFFLIFYLSFIDFLFPFFSFLNLEQTRKSHPIQIGN